ncbi:MAG: non-canonical purine NTP pyrophosphatase [Nanoarchaeota archaeon]
MTLYFITGNQNKFNEVKLIMPEIEMLALDLPEIQEMNTRKIIQSKLLEVAKVRKDAELFCEDTSLGINCLNGFPGPLIKWFFQTLGNKGIYELVSKYKDNSAYVRDVIGYRDKKGKMYFFEGEIMGRIVKPRGESNFGFDTIFQPEGYDRTFAEMTTKEKNKISHRIIALNKLKDFLEEEK